ncbi:MAG: membrane protein insertase YidC [Alphaproteobacteria bacterium]|nr:membrane protein insertase YidC [Alphaproteobacteria bacterium]MDX5369283.1 membrane protein insertase YidC [Alphaproteobacteria bacterium]MDX5463968.1 membrane protein insertase YidC [Alphaproteobacteria bacterium]
MGDNRNLILAFALSFLVLIAWQYFVAKPQMEAEQARIAQQQAAGGDATDALRPTPGAAGTSTPNVGTGGAVALPRADALAQSARVAIDTPTLKGSIALTGARIDDLALKNYRETVDPDSANIVLLSPQGSEAPYFAQFGWQVAPGSGIAAPGPDTRWTVIEGETLAPGQPLVLGWDNGQGLVFRRTISVDDQYLFTVEQSVQNTGAEDVTLFPYALIRRVGEPVTEGFYILHEGLIGVLGGSLLEVDYSDIAEEKTRRVETTGGWLGITDKYWMTQLVPDQSERFTGEFKYAESANRPVYQANYIRDGMVVPAGGTAAVTDHLFAGAKIVQTINAYEEQLGIDRFDLTIDWGWFFFLTKPIFYVLDWLFALVGNFGVAILLLTVLVKLLFFPLANKSYVAMSKMKKLQPEMLKIRDRYAEDKMKQQQAMMELYKTEKVNPLAGCLPILVQIPVFFALYKVLFVTIEMRHAPFFGWIQDLSAPDPTTIFNLFGLIPWDPPTFLMIGVWPLLMGITMFVQQRLNPPPADPTQAKVFLFLPVIFTFVLAPFAAGLVIYWTWNNLLSIIQQGVIMKRMGVPLEFYVGSKSQPKD